MMLAISDSWLLARNTILVGMVVNSACAIVGCWLLLRRLSLLGDAISHGVLPGIALAFLLTGKVTGLPILAGAMLVGMLTAFLTQTVKEQANVAEDASLGVVFTTLFAAGVLLIHYAASTGRGQVDLDPNCVLYGDILFVALDLGRTLPTMVGMLLGVAVFTLLFWKELKLATFDPALAAAVGLRPTLLYYALMALTAGVAVASFEAVGSILVVAMLIVPAATAQLLTERLSRLLALAVLVGCISSAIGYALAACWNASVAGMMAAAAGLQFALAVFFAPKHGLLSQALQRLGLRLRIAREDILSQLYRREEETQRSAIFSAAQLKAGSAPHWSSIALAQLRRRGLVVSPTSGELVLTPAGRQAAADLVRTHRLWERFLEENAALPLDHLHAPAERIEHFVGPAVQRELAEMIGPTGELDPHGKAIPAAPSPAK